MLPEFFRQPKGCGKEERMTLGEARKKNREVYEKTFDLITESCDRDSCNIPHEILKVIAEIYAAVITIREILVDKIEEARDKERHRLL